MTLPDTMRALQQTSLDGPEGLRPAVVPVPRPQAGEVVIRVAAAGINFVDVARARGTFGDNPVPPFVAGFEAAGEVVAVGEGVTAPAIGTVVIAAGPGAFAAYMAVPARAAMPVPAGWRAEQALGLAINWPTALAALELGRAVAGETVLVHAAAGATGAAAVRLAGHRGLRVIAAASSEKHGHLRAAGCEHVVDGRDPELAAVVRELTGGQGADLVIESAGGATFATSLAATKRITGRVVVIGQPGGNASISNWELVYRHPVQILGFNLGALIGAAPQLFGRLMGELGGLIAQGVVAPAQVMTYTFDEATMALGALERRESVGKLALVP